MNKERIIELASKGCMAYDDYDLDSLLEKARACEDEGLEPEHLLELANQCCGVYEFYNPVRLLRKAVECSHMGHDPMVILKSAISKSVTDFQPVRILNEFIDTEGLR